MLIKKLMRMDNFEKKVTKYTKAMRESLEHKDFLAYGKLKKSLDECVNRFKQEQGLIEEIKTTNFGILNEIFEENLSTLFKTNKDVVGKMIKLIKEDKNLSAEFQFYDALRNYTGNGDERVFTEQAAELARKEIVLENVEKSNRKVSNLMLKYKIYPSEKLSEEKRDFFIEGSRILCKKKTLSNMNRLNESVGKVASYIAEHKKTINENKVDIDKLMEDYDKKVVETLTEEERSLVQQITDIRKPIADKKREKFFNSLKEAVAKKIDELLATDGEDDESELKSLKEQIGGMQYNVETIVKDIAKLLEIRDTLCE